MSVKAAKNWFVTVTSLIAAVFTWSTAAVLGQNNSPPVATDYVCIQRAPHSRVWQRSILQTNRLGIIRTNQQSFTELCTGVCYQKNGQWVDSAEQIDLVADGAQAVQGRHQVHWASNPNTAGAVRLTAPGGQHFSSSVYGLAYWDASAGTNVLIAPLQDSTGVVEKNRVLYTNAFAGVNADLEYVYTRGGMEQNVVLREQPPAPSVYNLNPETTWLEVITVFSNAPSPIIKTMTAQGASDDRLVRFDDMLMGQGTAFLSGNTTTGQGFHVTKHWLPQENGNALLIEEVPYAAVSNLVNVLPPHSSNIKPGKRIQRNASLKSPSQQRSVFPKAKGPMKIAQNGIRNSQRLGFVIDYTLDGYDYAGSNFVFQGDTTYYISGVWSYYGSPGTLIFEGGTVVKYTNSATIYNYGEGVGVFAGSTYRPSVFTSWEDNSVGATISGSSGTPTYVPSTTYYLEEGGHGTNVGEVSNARFSFADYAYTDYDDPGFSFRDCQFVDCYTVMFTAAATNVSFENCLCIDCLDVFSGNGTEMIDAENITVDSCTALARTNSWWGPCTYSGGITNSIITATDEGTWYFATNDTLIASSNSGIYQTVGAAGYYLANNSPYRDAGTAEIDPTLLTDIQNKTTYPPVVVSPTSGWFTNNYTFFTQAQRDRDTPDLGYHYDPLDFAVSIALSNCAVKVLPGTALATMGSDYGICTYTGAFLSCIGTATSPNYIVRYNTVQEQSNTNWETSQWNASFVAGNSAALSPSTANFRFTDWSVLSGDGQLYGERTVDMNPIGLQDCQFYAGSVNTQFPEILVTNCLFQRINMTISDNFSSTQNNLLYNNLFLEGRLFASHLQSDTWTFTDNLFDQTYITQYKPIDICSNNAYVTNSDNNQGLTADSVLVPENNDVLFANSPAYEVGALGQNYYPTNLALIHAGSQTAAEAGLYHYAVTTNNVIESNSIVSIGFHYVAVGANGLPLDSNGNGIPDYLEDANGNGLVDSGEIDWLATNDLGLTVVITQPMNNSQIP
jgi:hypothetical protein